MHTDSITGSLPVSLNGRAISILDSVGMLHPEQDAPEKAMRTHQRGLSEIITLNLLLILIFSFNSSFQKRYILVFYTYSLRICSNSPPQVPNFQ